MISPPLVPLPASPSTGSTAAPWWTTIHGAFDRVAARCAGSVAIECEGTAHTYGDLMAASCRMARRLQEAGVGAGDIVGVCAGRSPEFVVTVLAILRCGAIYAPLPGDYPLPRLLGMVDDAKIRGVVTDRAAEPLVAGLRRDRGDLVAVSIDADSAWTVGPAATSCAEPEIGPQDPAYVMFTSGSTGRPRGVVVPHRAVTGLVTGQSFADFGTGLRTLLLAPPAFDASTFETWAPLLHGGTVVVYPDLDFDPARLGEVLRAGRVNCLWLTAGLFNLVVDLMPSALGSVAHVLTGGDVLSIAHVRRAFAMLPGIRITNGYGPTETTTFACTHAIDPADPFPDGTIPIGRPLAHTECVVVDEHGECVPDGVEGELWIGGSGVALGYLSGPETRFVTDPRGVTSGLWYRSGDRCRRRDDGTFMFRGRLDRQVKIRGHRVEPTELEEALAAHPVVGTAAAAAFDHAGGRALGAALTRRDGQTRPLDGLREWLADRLQPALVPDRIVVVADLPITPNGKVDREAVTAILTRAVADARITPEADPRRRILDRFNDTAVDLGPPATLHELIEHQVRRTPDAVAVEFEGTTLSFRELWSRACRLAAELRGLGAGPDLPVAICAERSMELVVGLVGILAAGAPYLPLGPEQPASRSAQMATIAGAAVVLVQRRFLDRVSGSGARAILLDDPTAAWRRTAAADAGLSAAELPGEPADLAYVIFTSGSTGEPKGVMNTHAGIVNRVRWMQAAYAIGPGDHVLQKTPYGFDVSVWEFFWPLIAGARLVVAPPGAHRDPRAVADIVERAGITVIHFVPSMLDMFLELPSLEESCRSLRHIFTSGEALSETAARETLQRIPALLHNLYGPTEAAVDATFHEFQANAPRGPVPIGRPIANMRAYVLDADRAPAGIGETGELWLAGVGVARGYVGRPDLTAERFVTDPFHGGAMYRTGDLARWRPDGEIEYLGRTDHQVKIRGVRVELGEIEAAIAAVDPGSRAVVVVRQHASGDARLVAYVAGGTSIDEPTCRERLAATLPASMVPSRIVRLAAFPVTANGKLDRAALPEPETQPPLAATESPISPTEMTLATLWRDVLGMETVGRNDDFFDSGASSLTAMRLVTRIEAATGVRLPVRTVFDRRRLVDLAATIDAVGLRSAPKPTSAPVVSPRETIDLPALPAQRGMWVLQHLLPDPATYNQPFAFRPRAQVDWDACRHRLHAAMARHPALRSALVPVGDTLVQRAEPIDRVPLPWQEVPETGPEQIAAVLATRAREPFDLAAAPLWRAVLFPAAGPHGVLLLLFHHAIIDDWSLSLLLEELGADAPPREPAPAACLPSDGTPDAARRHWSDVLDGAPAAVTWPGARSVPDSPTGRGGIVRFTVPAEIVAAWTRIARSRQATLFHAWLGACHAWLRQTTGCRDTIVLTPLAHRADRAASESVGCLLNMLPIRLRQPAGGTTAADVAAAARATFLDAVDHASLSYDEIVAALPGMSGSRLQPLGNVAFVLLEREDREPRLAGVPLERVDVHTGTARFDLTLSMFPNPAGGDADGVVEYSLDVLDESRVRAMVDRLRDMLAAVAADAAVDLGLAGGAPAGGEPTDAVPSGAPSAITGQHSVAVGAEPRGTTETAIAALWSEALGGVAVSRDDRFFDLGGNSLLAIRLAHALKRDLGVDIPVRSLFTAPRLRDMAALADRLRSHPVDIPSQSADAGPAAGESIVPLQPLGARPPLILCHGVGGGVSHFLPLAARLAPDIPVHGILSSQFSRPAPRVESMPELVARYADEIERFVPVGTVNLCSHSHGGWIVYEVARLLGSRRRRVGTVILLDTHPEARLPGSSTLTLGWPLLRARLERYCEWVWSIRRGHVPRTVRRLFWWWPYMPPDPLEGYRRDPQIRAFRELVAGHATGCYDGRVDLVRAPDARTIVVPHWRWLVGKGLRIHPVPILHNDLLHERHADLLGRLVRGILDDVARGDDELNSARFRTPPDRP